MPSHGRLFGHGEVHDHFIASCAEAEVFDDFLAILPAASTLFAAGGRHRDADRADAFNVDCVGRCGGDEVDVRDDEDLGQIDHERTGQRFARDAVKLDVGFG